MRHSTYSIAVLLILALFATILLAGCGASYLASPPTPTTQAGVTPIVTTSSPTDAPTAERDLARSVGKSRTIP